MSKYQKTTAEICLRNHEVYETKADLEEAIKDEERTIEELKQMLFGMVCGNPSDLFPQQGNEDWTPVEKAKRKFDEIMDIEDCGLLYHVAHLVDLYYMLDNFDKAEIDC